MTINGLNDNYYLIHNDINVYIDGVTADTKYLEITATNTSTVLSGKTRIYPINNVFKINLSPLLKSTFENIDYFNIQKNLNSIDLSFKNYNASNEVISSQTITKYYIRGGNFKGTYPDCETIRENYINDGDNTQLLISKIVPLWVGDFAYTQKVAGAVYVGEFLSGNQIEKLEIPCRGIKIAFINQYGTYSDWFFDNYEINDDTKSIGYVDVFQQQFNGERDFKDIGATFEGSITVKGSVPKRYNEIIRHLNVSQSIYAYGDGVPRKLILTNNKWYYNSKDNNFRYSITFDFKPEINPNNLC